MMRRRPPSSPEQLYRFALPRGLPGNAIVWIEPRSRKVVPAQWRARHAPVSGVSRVLGWGLIREMIVGEPNGGLRNREGTG